MSTSHTIAFFAKKKSPMIKFMIKTIKRFGKENKYPVHDFGDTQVYDIGSFVHEDGQTSEYFGGEELMKNYPDLKLWINMGGSNMTYREGNKTYSYPVPSFNKLLNEIKKSEIKNDVYLLCYNDIGGEPNKTNPTFRKSWTGKFI